MRLWTWQNPKLDITDPNMHVDSKKYSDFLCPQLNSGANQHLQKYEELWAILKTDQFHWYYTDIEQAKGNEEHCKGKVLWELDVPGNKAKKICSMAWHWILNSTNTNPPKIIGQLLFTFLWPDRATLLEDSNQYWRSMSAKELWDSLLCKCQAKGCCDALVRHPVAVSWVIKNPRKDINWWQEQ
jgi:hypothetical protein